MTRKVVISQKLAEHLLDLQREAEKTARKSAFRDAWIDLWNALHERPLPPDESDEVFGEPLYRTKHAPIHLISLGCARPLAVRFATCDEMVVVAGESVTPVFVLAVSLMS
jgi:hypothetical protein